MLNEIVRKAHDEIKSVFSPDEVGFHHASDFIHRRWIYSVMMTDLIEKSTS